LCKAAKTQALPTVIRRGIADCKDQSKFDNAVVPGLVRLLSSLLKRCGIENGPGKVGTAEVNVEALLRHARKVSLSNPGDDCDNPEKGIADRVARFVVSKLAIAMDEAKLLRAASPNLSFHTLPTSSSHRSDEVADLVSRREQRKAALERAAVEARSVLNLAIGTAANNNETPMPNGSAHRTTNGEEENVLLALVGQDTVDSIELQKIRLEELKAQSAEGESENLQELRAAVSSAEGERQSIQEKISELKASLEQLALQDEDLVSKIERLKGDVTEEERNASDLAKQRARKVQEAKDAIKYGNSVGALADMLTTYSKSLEAAVGDATTQPAILEESKQADDLAVKKMDVYMRHVRSYFVAEAQYVGQLSTRIDSTRQDVARLKMELEQCSGLGMATTTAQMESAVASKEATIDEDSKALEAASKDGPAAFDAFISRLEQYTTASGKESWKLQPVQSKLLLDVVAAAKKLDVANWERLQEFLPEGPPAEWHEETTQPAASASKSIPQTASTAESATSSAPENQARQNVTPKLTWASGGGTPSAARPKTSLLDIQKEELESRS
jgi:hypothetical protein